MAAAAPAHPQKPSDYMRLRQLEQKVVECISIAAEVAERLAQVHHTNEALQQQTAVQELCTKFMLAVKDAHVLLQQGVASHAGEQRLELHAYHAMSRAHVNTEKLEVVRMHVQALQARMEAAGAWQQRHAQQPPPQQPPHDAEGAGAQGPPPASSSALASAQAPAGAGQPPAPGGDTTAQPSAQAQEQEQPQQQPQDVEMQQAPAPGGGGGAGDGGRQGDAVGGGGLATAASPEAQRQDPGPGLDQPMQDV